MAPGGQWRTPADVAHPPLHDSRETNLTASSIAEFPGSRTLSQTTIGNEKTTIQSRRLVSRACEIARLPRLLSVRTFRLSKWLRHFFHRKEFRRKEMLKTLNTVGPCVFSSRGSRKGEERTSCELSYKQRTPTNLHHNEHQHNLARLNYIF